MPDYIMRPPNEMSMDDLHSMFAIDAQTMVLDSEGIKVNLPQGRVELTPQEPGAEKIEVPLGSLDPYAAWLDIPLAFLQRQDTEVQSYLIDHLFQAKRGQTRVEFTDHGIQEFSPPSAEKVHPGRLVEIATRVVGEDATVIDAWREPNEYRFDVVVSDAADHGFGGDLRVNDITRGGLRFGQSTKNNLAPWVSTFLYRLVCTNGMEARTLSQPDMRGKTIAQGLEELEVYANNAFSDIERQIDAFYALREQEVNHPERMVHRLAREHGIPTRSLVALTDRLPALLDDTDNSSMFDVVNAFTNFANEPSIYGRPNVRRQFERLGGAVVGEHAERCPRCLSSIAH